LSRIWHVEAINKKRKERRRQKRRDGVKAKLAIGRVEGKWRKKNYGKGSPSIFQHLHGRLTQTKWPRIHYVITVSRQIHVKKRINGGCHDACYADFCLISLAHVIFFFLSLVFSSGKLGPSCPMSTSFKRRAKHG
jgi:hypothetical protein